MFHVAVNRTQKYTMVWQLTAPLFAGAFVVTQRSDLSAWPRESSGTRIPASVPATPTPGGPAPRDTSLTTPLPAPASSSQWFPPRAFSLPHFCSASWSPSVLWAGNTLHPWLNHLTPTFSDWWCTGPRQDSFAAFLHRNPPCQLLTSGHYSCHRALEMIMRKSWQMAALFHCYSLTVNESLRWRPHYPKPMI